MTEKRTPSRSEQCRERWDQEQLNITVDRKTAEEFRFFCTTTQLTQEAAFVKAFALLDEATFKPKVDPQVRLLADAFKLALREAKAEGLL